jgi:DNA polymerase-3 subunit epsilon
MITVFDTETGGTDVWTHRIVTATVAQLDDTGTLIQERSWLINSGQPIDKQATAVHGITTEHAAEHGVDPRSAITEIIAALLEHDYPVVAFNAPFDFSILSAEAQRHDIDFRLPAVILDPFVLDKQMNRFRRGKRTLEVLTAAYGLPAFDAHDATADATAAGRLAITQLAMLAGAGFSPERLMVLQPGWHDEQAASLESYLRRANPDVVVDRGWPIKERP